MKKYIKSAEWKRYNANTRGTSAPDCVKRSMSLAFDIPYSEMGKLLNQRMKEINAPGWNYQSCYYPLMMKLGASPWIRESINDSNGDNLTLDELVDNVLDPNKVYLVETGKKTKDSAGSVSYHGNHLVCVREGKVWDSWDSRNQYVIKYSVVNSDSTKKIAEKVDLGPIAYEVAEPTISQQIENYIKKKNLNCNFWSVETTHAINYKIKVYADLQFDADELIDKKRSYEFNIIFPIEPTLSKEEVIEKVKELAKVRTYDRMYAIEQQENKLREAKQMEKQLGSFRVKWELSLSNREEKFVNSLPGWVKPLITYVSVESPGKYSDSYKLYTQKLPGDDKHPDVRRIEFEGYQSWMIKDMLERYKKTYEAPFEDYHPDEEY